MTPTRPPDEVPAIPLDHPVVREAAEGMAREAADAVAAVGPQFAPWSEYPDPIPLDDDMGNMDEVRVRGDVKRQLIDGHARLLVNLDREASRDWWVRFVAAHEGEQRAAAFRRHVSVFAPPPGFEADPYGEARARHVASLRVLDMRDNPTALLTAILAALKES